MPLSICDSSQKKRQAIQEEREKKRRRRSLPLTIESTTSVNPEKVHKRRLSRRLSKSDLLNTVSAQKANCPEQPVRRNSMNMANKENGQNVNAMPIQGPTPYWKIVAERGGQMSPRQTRSATKKQREHRPPLPSREGAKALFASPDDKAKHETEGLRDDHEGESLYEFSFPPRQENEDASDLTSETRQTHRRANSFDKDPSRGLEAAFAHIKTLENEKVDLVEQLATLRQQYQNTFEELEHLQSQAGMKMKGMTLTSERVEQERKEFVEKDHQKALQIEKLKGEVLRLEEKLHYVENDQIPELKNKLESANKIVLTEQEASIGHQSHVERLQREIQSKSQELENHKAKCTQLESEMNILAEENEQLQDQTESLETANKEMHDETETLKQKLDLLEKQHLSEAESKYKEALFKLQHEQERALRIEGELESARDEAAALRLELSKNKSEWESEKSRMIVEMEGLAKDTEALQEEINAQSKQHSTEIEELTAQLVSIKNEYNRIKTTVLPKKEAEIESLKAEMQKQKEVETNLVLGNKALKEEIDGLEEKMKSSRSEKDEISLSLDRAKAELESLQADLASKGSSNDELDKALKESLAELEAADSENNTLREKLKTQNDAFASRLQELEQLLQQERQQRQDLLIEKENISLDAAKTDERLISVENRLRATIRERDEANHYMATFGDREQELHQRLMESDLVRSQLHAKVMTLMGNIRVFIRCRPMTEEEQDSSTKEGNAVFRFPSPSETSKHFPADYKKAIELVEPKKDRGGLKPRTKKHSFSFDQVFEQTQGQDEVWEATEPLVQSAVDGANVTLFAYGQTGSGKTYTMLGEAGKEGIITRSIRKIFSNKRRVEADTKGNAYVQIQVELLEIYNEEIRDLLSKEKGAGRKNVRISMANQTVEGNKVASVGSEEECMKLLEIAQSRRCVKSTASNATSSRSHLVFTIHYAVEGEGVVERKGKLNVCDLAGSERLSKSQAHYVGGSLLRETQNINQSLSVLSNVIEQLQAGSKSVAYRESKLTSLLCDSLGGNSKTLAIVCVSPLESHYHESLSSLRFAEKSSKVELKAASSVTV